MECGTAAAPPITRLPLPAPCRSTILLRNCFNAPNSYPLSAHHRLSIETGVAWGSVHDGPAGGGGGGGGVVPLRGGTGVVMFDNILPG